MKNNQNIEKNQKNENAQKMLFKYKNKKCLKMKNV